MRYTLDTTLGEAMRDDRVMKILKNELGFLIMHPRFSEGYEYTFGEIVFDNMGEAIGLQEHITEKIVSEILELGE